MRNVAAMISLLLLAVLWPVAAQAGDAETIDEINQAAAELDAAFEKQDEATAKRLMTADHVAVTPYYEGPQSVAQQIASLPGLKYEQTNLSEAAVTLLGPDAALRSFAAELDGTFAGKPIPRRVFISALWVKRDGGWQERFYQVTAMRHGGRHGACRGVNGTYLTKNAMKEGSAGSVTSRSLLTLGRAGLALFTDSGQGGAAGFAPFTDGRGTWQCLDNGEISAITLDFTEPTAGDPQAKIGRLDFKLAYDAANKTLKGTATLYLIPLDQNPLAAGALKDGRVFEIAGERVEAP
jgi:hypothetical protein